MKEIYTQGKTWNCPVRDKDHHDIEDCPTFLTRPNLRQKQNNLQKKNLLLVSRRNFKR